MSAIPTSPGVYVMIVPGEWPRVTLVEKSVDGVLFLSTYCDATGELCSIVGSPVDQLSHCRWFGPIPELGGEK